MEKKEYLSVIEISKNVKMTTRNVRRIVAILSKEKNEYLIHKDSQNRWMIHEILLHNFKRQRIKKEKYYALTIDPFLNYSVKDINTIMNFVYGKINDPETEIHYTVEVKKANGKNHLHCFIKSKEKGKIIELIKLGFSRVSYKETPIYDLERWKQYITKDGCPINSLKN